MSVVKRIIEDNIERVKVDELLAEEYEGAGYGGITLTKTPLGAQINLFTMRPGRVIGKRGRAIKAASARLESELGLSNPQITVVEVEVPELNPRIMASRIANALERGVHYRRALFWSLRRTMEAGALGCEIVLRGKLRSDRGRYEKVTDGYIPKAGDPALKQVKNAVIHVKQKKGTFGVNVTIVPPEASFPDKVTLENLPEIEYPEEETPLPEGVEPEPEEAKTEGEEPEEKGEEPSETTTEEETVTTAEVEEIKEPEVPETEGKGEAETSAETVEVKETPTAEVEESADTDTEEKPVETPKVEDTKKAQDEASEGSVQPESKTKEETFAEEQEQAADETSEVEESTGLPKSEANVEKEGPLESSDVEETDKTESENKKGAVPSKEKSEEAGGKGESETTEPSEDVGEEG
ncbi:MAG: 30S ribosomal protein S3 [Candidatus Bathyarchaeota archaeon]|jgi:small subunit ribosomal protein S3